MRLIWYVIIISLILIPTDIGTGNQSTVDTISAGQLISHDPILIIGNSDFFNREFIGSGFTNDPFIIENLTFTNIVSGEPIIHIIGVSLSFTIQNNLIFGGGTSSSGILLSDVANVVIQDNVIQANGYNGVYLNGSHNIVVENNTISENGNFGIEAENGGSRLVFSENIIYSNGFGGIRAGESTRDISISRNAIYASPTGIDLFRTDSADIFENLVYENSKGIEINHAASRTTIYNNSVYRNKRIGLIAYLDSTGNQIKHNDFIQNGIPLTYYQATDDTGNLFFENNYYSDGIHIDLDDDGIADEPYTIFNQNFGNSDLSPRVKPHYNSPFHKLLAVVNSTDLPASVLSTTSIQLRWFSAIDSKGNDIHYDLYYSVENTEIEILITSGLKDIQYDWLNLPRENEWYEITVDAVSTDVNMTLISSASFKFQRIFISDEISPNLSVDPTQNLFSSTITPAENPNRDDTRSTTFESNIYWNIIIISLIYNQTIKSKKRKSQYL